MFHGKRYLSRPLFAGLMLLMLVGCRVPGRYFGGEPLQFRFARVTNETMEQARAGEKFQPPVELRRSAAVESVLLAGK